MPSVMARALPLVAALRLGASWTLNCDTSAIQMHAAEASGARAEQTEQTYAECDAGFYIGPSGTCVECTDGETRRRRSEACSYCPPGTFDAGDFDDCTPDPTPPPTIAPTPSPTVEGAGIPCPCLKNACFEAYDRDNNQCLEPSECDLQTPLVGCQTGQTGWDLDGDGCVNMSVEWDIVFDATNGTVCPVDDANKDQLDCNPGFYLTGNPASCVQCLNGATRRRRSFECSECEPGSFDAGDFDDCLCGKDTYISTAEAPAGSTAVTVNIVNGFKVGDNVTIGGGVAAAAGPATCDAEFDDCPVPDWETKVISAMTRTGFVFDSGLVFSYDKYAPISITCTKTDGTDLSRKYAESCGGLTTCKCGQTACDQYSACQVKNGQGSCVPVGPYPTHVTPAPTVGAKGDPHLVNLQGEHFDINHGGEFTLLRLPQSANMPAEFQLKAVVNPEYEKPCTTFITQVELSGSWLGNTSVQVRCYRKERPGYVKGTILSARLLHGEEEPPAWQSIEGFGQDRELVLTSPSSKGFQVTLDKSQWYPKKNLVPGSPTVGGMFSLTLRNEKNPTAAKIQIRQDLPEQEHLNLAVQHLSALGRLDVGGLLGFDRHPENLEYPSAECNHHRATEKMKIESQEDSGYYFKPAPWKERWNKIKQHMHKHAQGEPTEAPHDNEAAASLVGSSSATMMCKCPTTGGPMAEGVLVEEPMAKWAQVSWE